MLQHRVDSSLVWLCGHPGGNGNTSCSSRLSNSQYLPSAVTGTGVSSDLDLSLDGSLFSQSGGVISLNPASNPFSALLILSLSFLSQPTLLSHSYSVCQTQPCVTSNQDGVAYLPLDALTQSILPMASRFPVNRVYIFPIKIGHNSLEMPAFRRRFRTGHILSSHCSLSLHQPRASDSPCCARLFYIRKDCLLCPKPFVWLSFSRLHCALETSLEGLPDWVPFSIKKRLPPHQSGRVCLTSCVTYHCLKPSNMTLMPLAFPWIQMQFPNT